MPRLQPWELLYSFLHLHNQVAGKKGALIQIRDRLKWVVGVGGVLDGEGVLAAFTRVR